MGCETRGRALPVCNFNRLTTLSVAAAQLHHWPLYLPAGISHLFNRRGCLTADTGMPVAAGVRCLHLGCHLGRPCRSGAGLLFGRGTVSKQDAGEGQTEMQAGLSTQAHEIH